MKFLKYLGIGLGGLVLLIALAIGVAFTVLPRSRPASTERIEATPERLARGKYLAENVSGCIECHSERDWTKLGGPLKADTRGAGGYCLTPADGLPGTSCPTNITPDPKTGIGSRTDGELLRAMREGISHDGRALFMYMPYMSFANMSDEDARSIVAYLRTLPPVEKASGVTDVQFPLNLISRVVASPLEGPVSAPERTDKLAYGQYLVKISGCKGCHTNDGSPDYAGGNAMRAPTGESLVSSNITPDEETGIGRMSREAFIQRFKGYAQLDPSLPAVPGTASIMPWPSYAGMAEEDLGAIYDYLRTVPPARNAVVTRPRS
jgi:mono/diheme cytochrome c family protein